MATSVKDVPPILHLPDELLLQVVSKINGDDRRTTLRYLALTHSRFRPIATEVLVRNAVVPVRSIAKYLTLLEQHSEWIPRIRSVEFRDEGPPFFFSTSARSHRMCLAMVRKLLADFEADEIDAFFERERNSASLWLVLILAVLNKSETLIIDSQSTLGFSDFLPILAVPTTLDGTNFFYFALLEVMRHELRALTITTPAHNSELRKLTFIQFRFLKLLTIMGDLLEIKGSRQVERILPQSLEELNIFSDHDTHIWRFLSDLYLARTNTDNFYHLRQVQLCFNASCRSMANYANIHLSHRLPVRTILGEWKKCNTLFETAFHVRGKPRFKLDSYRQSCLLDEIEAVEEELGR
ncbi:hypothetical protein FB567DRAFT_623234 [Paraphoma chrysanthemicola]|uniref:F-box domain-containing protein n=1 Tax=Paraphoma chrysanthemicola TaxID=798071 RepID=A0A8K0RGI5_9PLEO|nr:hypothetical protein FB567DRAFT_623234 [Paraphoma chrysanthemicola]